LHGLLANMTQIEGKERRHFVLWRVSYGITRKHMYFTEIRVMSANHVILQLCLQASQKAPEW
jgi:hypothetical protein